MTDAGHVEGKTYVLETRFAEGNVARVPAMIEAFPGRQPLGVLWNADSPFSATVFKEVEASAKKLNVRIEVFDSGSESKLKAAYEGMRRKGVRALLVTNDPFLFVNGGAIAAEATRMKLPALFFTREIAEAGGLIAYGSSLADSYRRAAGYVDRIAKGAKPGDLPVDLPTKFELVVNLKTARTLGITLPRNVVARADQVIE